MIFNTKRLYARKLKLSDFREFTEMQENNNVMKYISGKAKTKKENMEELERLVEKYKDPTNDFLVMAIINKSSNKFVGTCVIIKNKGNEYEIGYRLSEKAWGN